PSPPDDLPIGSRSSREESFIRLLVQSHRSIYAYVRSLVHDATDADDCMQEVSLQLWRRIDSFDPGSSFVRWARGFARNVVRNHYRRSRARHLALDDDLLVRLTRIQGGAQELLELRRERLQVCLDRLPPADRQLLQTYYEEGESVERLARQAGRSTDSVYRALRRIRLALFRC